MLNPYGEPVTGRGSVEMGLQRSQNHLGARAALIVVGDIHPQHLAVGVHEQGSRYRQRFDLIPGIARMGPLISQPERVCHPECSVREHGGLQPVNASARADLFGVIGADGEHLNAALIELVPQFFPSP